MRYREEGGRYQGGRSREVGLGRKEEGERAQHENFIYQEDPLGPG
jgi:hypothetical protein